MARNFTRNTKAYISNDAILTNGVPDITKVNSSNTWEIKLLDGYDFSQSTSSEDIEISEAGTTPIRGQKTFNVAQDPADVSLPMYFRPYVNNASLVDAPERLLWASLAGSDGTVTDANGDMVSNVAGNGLAVYQQASNMLVDFEESDANELAKITIWFHLENTTYRVNNVNISSATIDFAIDSIASITWAGMGTSVTELSAADHTTISNWAAGTGGTGDYRAVPPTNSASFLRNKLSTVKLVNNEIATTPLDTGSATGGSTNTIEDTTATFITDGIISVGDYVRNVTTGETRVIASFTETVITIDGTWTTAPVSGNTYNIYASTDNAGQEYSIALTGGSIVIENNMNFLVPEELGVVNIPLPGFAGTRKVSGNVTAYLNTGSYGTSALLKDALENINSATNSYDLSIIIGGDTTAAKRIELSLASAQLSVPEVTVDSVIGTDIKFAGQGSGGLIENQDELVVTYYSN